MRRPRTIPALVVLVLVASAASAAPVAAKVAPGCPGAKALLVDATLAAQNVDDRALDGHVWALDAYTERVRLWRVGTDAYCARLDAAGSFTSFAGVSPAGTGTISAGVTGTLGGTQYISVTGEFAPEVPTQGFIGSFDAGCDQTGACASHDYRFTAHYFSRVRAVRFGWYSFTYDGGSHGTLLQSTNGVSGDITG